MLSDQHATSYTTFWNNTNLNFLILVIPNLQTHYMHVPYPNGTNKFYEHPHSHPIKKI